MARRSGPRNGVTTSRIASCRSRTLSSVRLNTPRPVALGAALEAVGEAERVQERLEPGVHVVAVGLVRAERVRDGGERPAQMLRHLVGVRDVVRHLAQAVHVVREGEQLGRQIAEAGEGLAHQRRAEHLGEGADMRQAGRAIAGLEKDIALGRRVAQDALFEAQRLDEGPSPALSQQRAFVDHRRGQVARAAGPLRAAAGRNIVILPQLTRPRRAGSGGAPRTARSPFGDAEAMRPPLFSRLVVTTPHA